MELNIDIKAKIEELVKKIQGDKDIAAKFQKDPCAVVESLLGIDLPNEQVNKIVDGIKAKIGLDNISGALGALGGILGKK